MSLKAIVALIVAIPKLKTLFDSLLATYVESQLESMREQDRAVIKRAIAAQDQREIERLLESPRAGEPSGVPGAEIRDHLPGVKP